MYFGFDLQSKLYVKIDSAWFDLTHYTDHPGGTAILRKYHCKDATAEFNSVKGHSDTFVDAQLDKYIIKHTLLELYLNLICWPV